MWTVVGALLSHGLLSSSAGFACAVCGLGQDDPSAAAFFSGTMLLSLMPLSMLGGSIFYVYRQTLKVPKGPTDPL